jgi:hypothetical protein
MYRMAAIATYQEIDQQLLAQGHHSVLCKLGSTPRMVRLQVEERRQT